MAELKGKVCTKCSEYKEYEHYHKKKSMKDGYRSACKECTNQQNAKYASKHPEKVLKSKAKYREANRDKLREKSADYRERNRDACMERVREWRKRNPEKYTESTRRYYIENKDEIRERRKQYDSRNKPKKAIREQRRRARMAKLPNNFSEEDWENCLNYFYTSCCYCGGSEDTLHQEHFVPVVKFGGYEKGNILPACHSCNSSKGSKDFSEWYKTTPFYDPDKEARIYEYFASVKGEGALISHM